MNNNNNNPSIQKAASAGTHPLRAGFGERQITPARPYPLAGFDLRKDLSTGVHDPLLTRVVLLKASDSLIALVEIDLLGCPEYLCSAVETSIKNKLPEVTGVQIGAIHTHAAPQSVFQTFASFDPDYLSWIADQAAEAALQAKEDLHPVKLGISQVEIDGIGSFRDVSRDQSRFAMPVQVIWLKASEQERGHTAPIALCLFACHPTVLSEQNLLISRDLIWGCDQGLSELAEKSGTRMPRVLYMNGACADISTRYTRSTSSFEEALRLGKRLAAAIVLTGRQTMFSEEGGFSFRNLPVRILPAKFFTPSERQAIVAYLDQQIASCTDAAQQREYIACRSVLTRAHYGEGNGVKTQISLLEIFLPSKAAETSGEELVLVGLPFEYAQKDAVRLSGKIAIETGKKAWIRCYTGGYEGYLPSGRPLDKDSGYEDMASGYAAESKEVIASAVLKAVGKREPGE